MTSRGKGFTSFPPRLTQGWGGGQTEGCLKDEPLLVEGASETSGDGGAGVPGGGGVSRQRWEGGQCRGARLLLGGLAGLPPSPSSRSPGIRYGVLFPHWVRSW